MKSSSREFLRKVCMVDAYGSSGIALTNTFLQAGFTLIHIQSHPNIPKPYIKSFQPSLFNKNFIIENNNDTDIINQLRLEKPDMVIAVSEPSIATADWLATELQLPGNSPKTSRLRRDKYEMGEALKRASLATIRQAQVSDLQTALNIARSWNKWPLVLKPLNSGGSEGVRFCTTEKELANAFNEIYMQKNVFNAINNKILIQERIYGQQYVVNAVSVAGQHKITEMWKEDRVSVEGAGSNIYDKELLIPYHGDIQEKLIDYVKKVLDAVDIKEGASHSEVMMTAEGIPVLIEIAGRLQGGIESSAIIAAIGDSHVTTLFKSCTDRATFLTEINDTYQIKKNAMVVNLISKQEGTLTKNNCDVLLPTLPSFHLIVRTPKVGDFIPKTVDLLTKAGHIYLLHENVAQLEKDYQQIRTWERENKLLTSTSVVSHSLSSSSSNKVRDDEKHKDDKDKKSVTEETLTTPRCG